MKDHQINLLGLTFRSPLGLAAGFDKNGTYTHLMEALGFGFIEVGSVTFKPWTGNPRPRLFRLPADQAIINRMGLNNLGATTVARNLHATNLSIPLFVNIAKTPDKTLSESETIDDYCQSILTLKSCADVIVLNLSCPNADGGKTFEEPELLSRLLIKVRQVLSREEKPLLVKLSPDLSHDNLQEMVKVCESFEVDGYTATNTTTARNELKTRKSTVDAIGNGGLSGAPLHLKSLDTVRRLRTLTDKPIIGVGGIMNTEMAKAFLIAGASLVQLYSGFVYGGPDLPSSISNGLKD